MATGRRREAAERILRITDIAAESEAMHTPIIDYDNIPAVSYADTPIVTLEKAVEPLVSLMPAVRDKVVDAKEKCTNPPADGLTLDESASIILYSMEWQPRNKCLYVVLNNTLRSKDKENLKLWFLYLKLFRTALERLPSKHRTVYRGVKLNLHKEYRKGDTTVWWGFSSSTVSIGVLKKEIFLGQSGDRTMFAIECDAAKDIQKHSYYPEEDEILIPAGTQFKVIDSLDHGHGLHMIQLEQTKPTEPLLQQLLISSSKDASAGKSAIDGIGLCLFRTESNRTGLIGKAKAAPSENMHNPHPRIVQTFLLIWLDSNIDGSKDDYKNSIAKLQRVVNDINIFNDPDECMQFLANINEEKAFIIISGALGERVTPTIHEMRQIDAIFIFCGNKSRHEKWAKHWPKIKGVFTDINSMCECIKQAAQEVCQDAITISFVATSDTTSKKNLDQLDPSYMYTQILKKILLEIDFENVHFQDFIKYCSEILADNSTEMKNLRRFEKEYHSHTPIWWYTCECFLYPMLNRALRTMDFDILVKIGFFICDLHRHIEKLYSEQFDVHHHKQSSFIAYRGQGMSEADFEKLAQTKGGLIPLNNFLSVHQVRDVSLEFAHRASVNPDLVGILFQITINPSISSTPLAYISDVSYFKSEEEILFSMHSVFRIEEIQPIDNHSRLYQVNLTLTSDEDPDLRVLKKAIQEEIAGPTGWHRLGNLLLKLGQFDNAQQLYEVLLEQTTDNRQKSLLYNQLGLVKNGQGDYADALAFYEKSLKFDKKFCLQIIWM